MLDHSLNLQNALENSLMRFLHRCFIELHSGQTRFLAGWHIKAMCHQLQRVKDGKEKRLIITIPPRHLKSIATSVAFVAWRLGLDPTCKIMVVSYSEQLAVEHSNATRRVMQSGWYKALFPRTVLTNANQFELRTSAGGFRRAVTVGGAITGLGADMIVIDDPIKAADAQSPVERSKLQSFFEGTLISRLNDQRFGSIVLVQQRLHEDDLAGYLLDKGGYFHLNLPAIAEEVQAVAISDTRVHQRVKDDILFPAMHTSASLERLRTEMGPAAFSAQFQQNPTPPGGNRIRWEWFGTYNPDDYERGDFTEVIQSWDTGASEEPGSAYSVGTTWALQDKKWHLLDIERDKLSFPDLKTRVKAARLRHCADYVLIEKASSGLGLLQQLRREDKRSNWIARTPTGDKELRVEAITGHLVTGMFLVPTRAPWLSEFRRELLGFPKTRYFDQVDSLSQFVEWITSRRNIPRDPVTNRPIGHPYRLGAI